MDSLFRSIFYAYIELVHQIGEQDFLVHIALDQLLRLFQAGERQARERGLESGGHPLVKCHILLADMDKFRHFLLEQKQGPQPLGSLLAKSFLPLAGLQGGQGFPRLQRPHEVPLQQGIQKVVEKILQLHVLRRLCRMHIPLVLLRQRLHPQVQTAGRYGLEHLFRSVGNEDKEGFLRRFLHHLQQRIGRLHVQFFRQIQHHAPVPAFYRRKRQPVQDGAGLVHGNVALFALYADGRIQFGLIEIRIFLQKGTESRDKLQGYRLVPSGNREHEMNVRVDEFLHTRSPTVKLFQEVQDNGKSAPAVVLVQQQGMRNMAALHHPVQGIHKLRIPIDFHPLFISFGHKTGQFRKIAFFLGFRKDIQARNGFGRVKIQFFPG